MQPVGALAALAVMAPPHQHLGALQPSRTDQREFEFALAQRFPASPSVAQNRSPKARRCRRRRVGCSRSLIRAHRRPLTKNSGRFGQAVWGDQPVGSGPLAGHERVAALQVDEIGVVEPDDVLQGGNGLELPDVHDAPAANLAVHVDPARVTDLVDPLDWGRR